HDALPIYNRDLQMIHDSVVRLTNGAVCKSSEADARAELENQNTDLGADTHNDRNASASKALESVSTELPAVTTTLKGIEAALSNLDIKALHETVATTKADIDGLTIKAAALSKRVSLLHEEEAAIRGSIASLTNLPLGNPTRMLRGVDPEDESVVTHEQLRRIGNGGKPSASAIGLTLDEALSQTTLVKGADDMEYREWPAGVSPEGGRPELSVWQKNYTLPETLLAYRNGEAARIPEEPRA